MNQKEHIALLKVASYLDDNLSDEPRLNVGATVDFSKRNLANSIDYLAYFDKLGSKLKKKVGIVTDKDVETEAPQEAERYHLDRHCIYPVEAFSGVKKIRPLNHQEVLNRLAVSLEHWYTLN